MNLVAVAIKEWKAITIDPELQPHYQMQFTFIQRKLPDKIKRKFFKGVARSILLYKCTFLKSQLEKLANVDTSVGLAPKHIFISFV